MGISKIKLSFILFLSLVSVSCSQDPVKQSNNANVSPMLQIGTQTMRVEIARTETAREQGLSGREKLPDNQGMLFDFNQNTSPPFWMKGMKFNLDLIWIKNNSVIGITKNVPAPPLGTPDSQLPLYNPPSPIDTVLEVNGGWADAHGIRVGDMVKLLSAQ